VSTYTDVVVFWDQFEEDSIVQALEEPFGEAEYQLQRHEYLRHPARADLLVSGSFKNLNWAELFAFIERLPWEYPNDVQVMLHTDEDFGFGVYELVGGRLTPMNPMGIQQIETLVDDEGWTQGSGRAASKDEIEAMARALVNRFLARFTDHAKATVRIESPELDSSAQEEADSYD
jgi:hypothetical protein